jgi:hypothetical protein
LNEKLGLFVALTTVPVFSSSNSGLSLTYLIEQVSQLEPNHWQFLEGSSHSIDCRLSQQGSHHRPHFHFSALDLLAVLQMFHSSLILSSAESVLGWLSLLVLSLSPKEADPSGNRSSRD